jgi:SsrA-binding protein
MARTDARKGRSDPVVATNRRARRNYEILETLEAGIALRGSEVKSLRDSKVQITDAYARFDGNELWLQALHISPYSFAQSHSGHDPDRRRKLLLHRAELNRLRPRVEQEHLSLVPLSIYFKDGRAKVELALARGRKAYDKRQAIAERDAALEARRAMAQRGRQRPDAVTGQAG